MKPKPNPRHVKRTINSFLFLSRLADARVRRLGKLDDVRLSKVIVIQHTYPELYRVLRREPRLLADLETYYRALGSQAGERMPDAERDLPTLADRLQPFSNIEALRALLMLHEADYDACFAGLRPLEIRPYFTLVKGVGAPEPEVKASAAAFEPQTINIPAGEFLMGTSDEEIAWLLENTDWAKEWVEKGYFNDEKPQRAVWIDEYAIGRYPVTNLEYQAFVEGAGYDPPRHWNGPVPPEEIADHPVTYVGHEDALAYCDWLSGETETGWIYRLPTEAEWEKAARGTDGLIYPWGTPFDPARCNTAEGGPGGTTPVGQYSPEGDSVYGCADMAGNVWEWCADWYDGDYYHSAPRENPTGPPDGTIKVVRGGSWSNDQDLARCAYRRGLDPDLRSRYLGFRVVLAPPISEE